MFDGTPCIGQTLLGRLEPGQQHQVVAPGYLSNSLLDDCLVRPRLGESPHVHEVGAREALHGQEGATQVLSQPFDHLGAPAFPVLPRQDVAADLNPEPSDEPPEAYPPSLKLPRPSRNLPRKARKLRPRRISFRGLLGTFRGLAEPSALPVTLVAAES